MIPCVVITRDRVSYTQACIASLQDHPDLDIHIVDHGSTWPPMLEWLKAQPHPVHYAASRAPRDLWGSAELDTIVGRHARYLVTDPDIVLDNDCPADWLDQLQREFDRGSSLVKVGLGLRLDDLPDTELAQRVRQWEAPFWQHRRVWSTAWSAPVDTTLALYDTLWNRPSFLLAPAARLDVPYLIRHLPWYGNPDPAETEHYRNQAVPGSSHWINGGW
jgi:hypothetical protein